MAIRSTLFLGAQTFLLGMTGTARVCSNALGWGYGGARRRAWLVRLGLQGLGKGQHLVENHHLVPQQVARSSAWLRGLGYDPHRSHNLMLLPTRRGLASGRLTSQRPVHDARHDRYNAHVAARLAQLQRRVGPLPRHAQLCAVYELEHALRCSLRDRTRPLC